MIYSLMVWWLMAAIAVASYSWRWYRLVVLSMTAIEPPKGPAPEYVNRATPRAYCSGRLEMYANRPVSVRIGA